MDAQREDALGTVYDLALLRRLWRYVRPYRAQCVIALLCLPLTSVCALAQPYILKLAVDQYIAQRDLPGLAVTGLLFVGALVGEFVFFYWQYYATVTVAQKSLADLRLELFAHLQRLPAGFFERHPVGRLVTRLTTDVDAINEAFTAGTLTIFMDLLTLGGIVAILFALDLWLALVTLSLLPPLVVALNFFRVRSRETYRAIRERIARINAFLQETLSGMTVVQLFAQEGKLFAEFERRNREHRDANHLANIYEASLFSLVEAAGSISIALMLWYGAGQVGRGTVALGTLVAFIEYLQKFFVPIREFSTKYTTMQSAMTALERVFQLLDTPVTITSPPLPYRPRRVQGRVAFEHVWFAYRGEEWVLRDVSFTVEPGEKVALVGATGAGKTTISKLLNRSYDVQRGAIFVDGVDVRQWDVQALRRQVGVVLQDVFLFATDVATNITLGRTDLAPQDLERVARSVNADRFIRALPRGYAEPLRERGSNLSAGQRQLLSFARVLAYDPAILVLDEATSSVDAETEMLIQDALAKLMAGRTTLIIAHRLSTVQNADRIVVMHKGQLREMGTHQELLARQGIYWRLYRLQYRETQEQHFRPATSAGTGTPGGDFS
ncbi:MAG: ABC transporter ATP-binding protein/permease [Candidatus Binatia bacterium]|nr:ABC transporter ATP-binding protein/permease [Candidatus Binatia bacterium]